MSKKSNCCDAPVIVIGYTTKSYVCLECKEYCSLHGEKEYLEAQIKMEAERITYHCEIMGKLVHKCTENIESLKTRLNNIK